MKRSDGYFINYAIDNRLSFELGNGKGCPRLG